MKEVVLDVLQRAQNNRLVPRVEALVRQQLGDRDVKLNERRATLSLKHAPLESVTGSGRLEQTPSSIAASRYMSRPVCGCHWRV